MLALLFSFISFSPEAQAGLLVEDNLFYFSNSLTTDAKDTQSRMVGSIAFCATIPKIWFIGWNINYVSRSTGGDAGTATLSGLEMGPRVGIFVNKNQTLSLTLGYNPLVKGSYAGASGSSLKLSGSGFQFELGYAPQVAKNLWAGMKLVYTSTSYSSATNSSDHTATVSYSQSYILPTVYLSWRFGS